MKRTLLGLAIATMFVSGVVVVRADNSTTQPSEPVKEKHEHKKGLMITQPYNQLTDLTDDQKQQISDLHKKALDDVAAITSKEKADDLAVLTDDQKKELDAIETKHKEEEAKKRAEHEAKMKAEKEAATQPAPGGDAK